VFSLVKSLGENFKEAIKEFATRLKQFAKTVFSGQIPQGENNKTEGELSLTAMTFL